MCTWVRRTTARLHVLPLVCTRWKRITKLSQRIWAEACFELSEIFGWTTDRPLRTPDPVKMAAWFRARRGRFKRLGLYGLLGSVQLPPAVTSMLISTQVASLMHLSIDVTPSGLGGPELGVLASVDGLIELIVIASGHGFSDWGAAVIRAASLLTALRRLDLIYVKQSGGGSIARQDVKLPRCQDLAVLSSDSLTMMTVVMASGAGDVLHLAGLRKLQTCRLSSYAVSTAEFRVQSASFAGCTGLLELTLCHMRGLILQPGCFRALSAVSKLTLSSCGLRAIPADIAQLTALRRLNLRNNQDLTIDEIGADVLRTLKRLCLLVVTHDAPKSYDLRHFQVLFDLMAAFHREGLQLIVQTDPASAEEPHEPAWVHFGIL